MQVISSYCSADKPQCVSVEPDHERGGVIVRNTQGVGAVFATWAEWDAFTAGVRDGQFDTATLRALTAA